MSIVKLSNNGVKNATSFGSASSGSMAFIKKLTASSSATLSFVDGASDVVLDNTYKEYLFTFNNIHPATNGVQFLFKEAQILVLLMVLLQQLHILMLHTTKEIVQLI